MLIKEYFIYKENGMIDEYNKILDSLNRLFKANGGNKEALKFLYKLLEDDKKKFEDEIELKSLEFILRERALSEISEGIKDEKLHKISDKN